MTQTAVVDILCGLRGGRPTPGKPWLPGRQSPPHVLCPAATTPTHHAHVYGAGELLNAHRVPADRTLAHRVLIVDGSQENRLVLRAALERRGMQILEADAVDDALRLADRHRPDLIVVDLELDQQTGDDICGRFDRQGRHTPLVLLGSARRREPVVPMGQFVAKPYHYGPLIRTIEGLLDRSRQADCD